MKLRILNQNVGADLLQAIKASIAIELTKTPMNMTYEQALSAFRDEVNRKHPPELSQNTRPRRIQQTQFGCGAGRSGRGFTRGGRGRGRGFGRGGRGGRGRGHPEARFVTGMDGKTIEVHPAYKFNPEV